MIRTADTDSKPSANMLKALDAALDDLAGEVGQTEESYPPEELQLPEGRFGFLLRNLYC